MEWSTTALLVSGHLPHQVICKGISEQQSIRERMMKQMKRQITFEYKFMVALYLLFHILDLTLTYVVLGQGGIELNPFFAKGLASNFILYGLFKLSGGLGVALLFLYLYRIVNDKQLKFVQVPLACMVLYYLFVVIWNAMQVSFWGG